MNANLPQTLEGVTLVYERLCREGVIRDASQYRRGDWVQVRLRGAVLCGQVVGEPTRAVGGGGQSATRLHVRTAIGDYWVRTFDSRPCSQAGDGVCACADAERARTRGARRFVSPLGNTGVAV